MIVYLDTSALVKLLIEEEDSAVATQVWEGADLVVTNRLAYPEARAALAAGVRGGLLTSRAHHAAKRELARLWQELYLIEITADLTEAAGNLAEDLALRGYDAVHLASAQSVGGRDLVLATWDRMLAKAAQRIGISVAPPLS